MRYYHSPPLERDPPLTTLPLCMIANRLNRLIEYYISYITGRISHRLCPEGGASPATGCCSCRSGTRSTPRSFTTLHPHYLFQLLARDLVDLVGQLEAEEGGAVLDRGQEVDEQKSKCVLHEGPEQIVQEIVLVHQVVGCPGVLGYYLL